MERDSWFQRVICDHLFRMGDACFSPLPAEKAYMTNSEQTHSSQNSKVRDRKPKPTVFSEEPSFVEHHFWLLILFFVVVIILVVHTTKLEKMFST